MPVVILDNPEDVARAAADRFVEAAHAVIETYKRFTVALSGGNTPRRVFELLASEGYQDRVDWSHTHVFFGDERCVPADHPESNYRMAREALLSRVSIPAENVHAIKGEGDPAANAINYDEELRRFFNSHEWPRFDLVFLGLGDDGHTASLFPRTVALKENKAWVAANWVEKLGTWRITLTAPVIKHAARIIFLVTGTAKAEALAAVLNGPKKPEELPAQLIQPVDGSLEWLVDKAAARLLLN
jgi:6-phosphogluconolactonase